MSVKRRGGRILKDHLQFERFPPLGREGSQILLPPGLLESHIDTLLDLSSLRLILLNGLGDCVR